MSALAPVRTFSRKRTFCLKSDQPNWCLFDRIGFNSPRFTSLFKLMPMPGYWLPLKEQETQPSSFPDRNWTHLCLPPFVIFIMERVLQPTRQLWAYPKILA
jgi:hypothetical protein